MRGISVDVRTKRSYGRFWNSHDSARELSYFGRAFKSNRQNYSTNARLRKNNTRKEVGGMFSTPRATLASKEEVGEGIQSQSEKYVQEERVGVLLLNLGGPETLDDVQPFLYNLFADPVSLMLLVIVVFMKYYSIRIQNLDVLGFKINIVSDSVGLQ